jgi:hypothetical protein
VGVLGVTHFSLCSEQAYKRRVIRFDAIIELYSPRTRSYTALFARYWIAPEFYEIGVVWGEPHGRGLSYPIYPPTLNVSKDIKRFSISHAVFPERACHFDLPIGRRGAFTNMFGDYDFRNIRFADADYSMNQIFWSDLCAASEGTDRMVKVTVAENIDGSLCQVGRIEGAFSGEDLRRLTVLGRDNRPVREIEYEYDSSDTIGGGALRKKIGILHERPVDAVLPGRGARVRHEGSVYQINNVKSTHRKGQRRCEVGYKPVMAGGRFYSLPISARVWGGDGALLRSAKIMNFQEELLSPNEAKNEAISYSGFSAKHYAYRRLLEKYWMKRSVDVSSGDIALIGELQKYFGEKSGDGLGSELRRLNSQMELFRMREQDGDLATAFKCYLKTLIDGGLPEAVLVGGQSAIDSLVIWRRPAVASRLLDSWLSTVRLISDFELFERFLRRELGKGNLWSTIKLIDTITGPPDDIPASIRFDLCIIRIRALHRLYKLMRLGESLNDDITRPQVDWVGLSISVDKLRECALERAEEALMLFNALTGPTSSQLTSKDALMTIRLSLLQEGTR